jgi:hypothetical protein
MFEVILSPEAKAFFASADKPLANEVVAILLGIRARTAKA